MNLTNARRDDIGVTASLLRDLMPEARMGWPDALQVKGPVSVRPQSRVYRLDLPDGARSLAIKQYLEPPPLNILDNGSAELQFASLSRCFDAMQRNSLFRVPEPIYLLEDNAIVLMEWIDGESFFAALCRRGSSVRTLMRLSRLVGAWLRAFHEAGSASVSICGTTDLRNEIERVRIAMNRNKIVLSMASRALESLAEYLPTVSARSVQRTWLHGDFQPENILFGADMVFGIDIMHLTSGVALADVAHFLNQVRKMAFLPSGLHLLTSYQPILSAFVTGYSGDHCLVDPLVLSWYRLLDDLRFLIRYHPHLKSAAHRWYLERLQSAAIRQHVAMLHSCINHDRPGRKILGRGKLPSDVRSRTLGGAVR
jgi:Phosphotransferase enzyme family